MSERISTIATEHYASFLVAIEGEGCLGCHLPRGDGLKLVETLDNLLAQKEDFPEETLETESTEMELMGAGLTIMFSITNKLNERRTQFAISVDDCCTLQRKLESTLQNAARCFGEPKPMTKAWRFFETQPKEKNAVLQKMSQD